MRDTGQPDPDTDIRINPTLLPEDGPDFQELIERHEVDRDLVVRLLRLVTERHYGSTSSDTSLREDVETELAKAQQRKR